MLNRLRYDANKNGIQFQTINEAFTSKCDALAGESLINHYRQKKGVEHKYLGKRAKRGLYASLGESLSDSLKASRCGIAFGDATRSSKKKYINADTNASLNMIRKKYESDQKIHKQIMSGIQSNKLLYNPKIEKIAQIRREG